MSTPTPGFGLLVDDVLDLVDPSVSRSPELPGALRHEAESLTHRGFGFLVVRDRLTPIPLDGAPRLDSRVSVSFLARAAPGLALVPGSPIGSLEPFHVAKQIQTLDQATDGLAGLLVEPGRSEADAALIAHVTDAIAGGLTEADHAAYAGEFVDVLRALWESWAPGSIVRDLEAGLYLDPEKVRPIHHSGRFLTVRGPSLTPRSPQGAPPVLLLAESLDPRTIEAVNPDVVIAAPDASVPSGVIHAPLVSPESARAAEAPTGSVIDGRRGGYRQLGGTVIGPSPTRGGTLRQRLRITRPTTSEINHG